jgi:uridine kinase
MTTTDLDGAVDSIGKKRQEVSPDRSVLVALSGIDGSGKGYVSRTLANRLEALGHRVALINADGWLNLPHIRYSTINPAEHFYQNIFRFDEMFAQLIIPLRDHRSIRVETDFTEETSTEFQKHVFDYSLIDIIILEGCYLFKSALVSNYDLSYWIDCTFETALERAISRAQEGLPPEATVEAYQTIYFPAERIHFERDLPQNAATARIVNDHRLTEGPAPG